MKITEHTWPAYARTVASPAEPEDYNEEAIERLMRDLSPFVVDVKGVRPQFSARNRVELIDFDNDESRGRYEAAFAAYLEAMGKENSVKMVEDLKFSQAAEIERCPYFARTLHHNVEEGFAGVCAAKFKGTLAKTAYLLMKDFGIPRDRISLIWGGDEVYAGKRAYLSHDEIEAVLLKAIKGEASKKEVLMIKKQILASLAGIKDIPASYRLDVQSAEERQDEVLRFQKGHSHYCLYSFKSGGVGLSLHHTDEWTKEKVRRKKDSNYAVEEDIGLIPTRPRRAIIAPTYSAIELVQALGRCPRITSLSNTEQSLVFYRGTIEEAIAIIVSRKLKCLRQVVRKKESWQEMLYEGRHNYTKTHEKVDSSWVEHENISVDDDEEDEED